MPVDNEITFDLEQFQADFYESRFRYPGAVMGWGTGKTLLLILRVITQSEAYPDNLGLIVRKKFTDLRDSTIKDFERYTGLHVPMSTKEITWPGTNSVIMFRHGDELTGLQNINLGWYAIEQAEEFDSADEFDMLRGRTRRELTANPNFDTSGQYHDFLEWLITPYWDPEKDKMVVGRRIGMVIANANGHNWVWRRWIKGIIGNTEYDGHEADTNANRHNLPSDFIKDLAAMQSDNAAKYRRYVLNDHKEMDVKGAYYAATLAEMYKADRIGKVKHNINYPVHVILDFGYTSALWFVQEVGCNVHAIRYYEEQGRGIERWVGLLKEYAVEHKYRYGDIVVPCDMDSGCTKIITGESALETLRGFGYNAEPLAKEKSVDEGIVRTIKFMAIAHIDAEDCEQGIVCLERYHQRLNATMSTDEVDVFTGSPDKDGYDHGADAWRYVSKAFYAGMIRNDSHNTVTAEQAAKWAVKYKRVG